MAYSLCQHLSHPHQYDQWKSDYKPIVNASDAPPKSNISQDNTDISSITDYTDSSDVTRLLVPAFNLMGNHPDSKDTLTESLMAYTIGLL